MKLPKQKVICNLDGTWTEVVFYPFIFDGVNYSIDEIQLGIIRSFTLCKPLPKKLYFYGGGGIKLSDKFISLSVSERSRDEKPLFTLTDGELRTLSKVPFN
jgi:hypothetical protein